MRIWFDLSNSPHINLFYQLIRELEAEGHEIIITTRPLANTIDLLNQKQMSYTVIGNHYGKNFFKKVFGYPIRVLQLYRFLKQRQPDLAVSQSSFHSPLVAKLLGIPSIYTNDNEHALGNRPAFFFATKILIPETLDISKVAGLGVPKKKITQYPGVKEGIFLWSKAEDIKEARAESKTGEMHIYIRPEPRTAQYYKGKQNFLDEVIIGLQDSCKVTVLARDRIQADYYRKAEFNKVIVPELPLGFDEVATTCTLFIGAGGSMTRELAILGVPCISVYQDDLLDVDRYLISKGLIQLERSVTAAKVKEMLPGLSETTDPDLITQKGKEAYRLFKHEILSFDTNKATAAERMGWE